MCAEPRVAVIGARGFIGRRLVRELRGSGAALQEFTRERGFLHDGQVDRAVLEADVIYFLASRVRPASAAEDPRRAIEDLRDVHTLLQGLRATGRRPVLVFASSGGAVYSPAAAPPYSEASPTGPTSEYGVVKVAMEAELAAGAAWVAPVCVRLANVYGAGQPVRPGFAVVAHWTRALHERERIELIGDPGTIRDYVHVADVTRALVRIAGSAGRFRSRAGGTVLNIGSGVPTSLGGLLGSLEEVTGERALTRGVPARRFDRRDVWLDIGRARETLGWSPEVSLAEGLKEVWNGLEREQTAARG
ncbi:NAD-dependent epimerase/dehydratase family protein [Streptomyces iconiensis]|uniref:NAD-dependent epimerase/dehydratase family protein n=1 Tax=Streptomyces iconiensis TaxID=1384038 RepID=A0ABT7A106_9ACTN|nr:NAD-dependent epimerase/dehydratase family protein [Streptomyces iconiensis]MDJ1134999.1 NAD-dependent epimerase/dehydratase family protein [Streptomyces iconiensis]